MPRPSFQKGNPGKPKGAKNKMPPKDVLREEFIEHGIFVVPNIKKILDLIDMSDLRGIALAARINLELLQYIAPKRRAEDAEGNPGDVDAVNSDIIREANIELKNLLQAMKTERTR